MRRIITSNKAILVVIGISIMILFPTIIKAQSLPNDGISFYNADTGAEKRIFTLNEDVQAKITLDEVNKGKELRAYVFNPYGELVLDTTVTYQNPLELDIDESIKGEHIIISNIKGDKGILRYSVGVGKKIKFDKWWKYKIPKKGDYLAFTKFVIDANGDGKLQQKEMCNSRPFNNMNPSGNFKQKDNKLIVYYFKNSKLMESPDIRIPKKKNRSLVKYIENESEYSVIDFSKVQDKGFMIFINKCRGVIGIK